MTSSRPNCASRRAGATSSANPAATRSPAAATSTPTPSSPRPPERSSTRKAVAASSCPPESPLTRRPLRSSVIWFAIASSFRSWNSRMRHFCLAVPSIIGSLLSAHRLWPCDTRKFSELRVRHPLYPRSPGAPVRNATGRDPARQPQHRYSARVSIPRDAEITIGIYKRVPVLWRDDPEENPWGLSFMAMFHMANDSGLFRTRDQLERDGWISDRQRLHARERAHAPALRGQDDPSFRPSLWLPTKARPKPKPTWEPAAA